MLAHTSGYAKRTADKPGELDKLINNSSIPHAVHSLIITGEFEPLAIFYLRFLLSM